MRFHVDCAIDVDASSLEEAMSKVELSVRDREGVSFGDFHISVCEDERLRRLVFSRENVMMYLLDGDEMSDDETVDLWNELVMDDPKKFLSDNLGWLLAANFAGNEAEQFLEAMDFENADMNDPFFWFDRETGELCNGHIGDAIDCGVDFSLMANKLIKSDFDVNGIEDLKEKIKEYVLEKILL